MRKEPGKYEGEKERRMEGKKRVGKDTARNEILFYSYSK